MTRQYIKKEGRVTRFTGKTPEERSKVARHASNIKWAKYSKEQRVAHMKMMSAVRVANLKKMKEAYYKMMEDPTLIIEE